MSDGVHSPTSISKGKAMIRDFLPAAMLMGGSLFMFFFGPNGIVLLVYSVFPADTQEFLWSQYPPSYFGIGYDAQFAAAIVMFLAGLWYSVGLWVTYPNCRPWLVGVVTLMWVVTLIMADMTYGRLSVG